MEGTVLRVEAVARECVDPQKVAVALPYWDATVIDGRFLRWQRTASEMVKGTPYSPSVVTSSGHRIIQSQLVHRCPRCGYEVAVPFTMRNDAEQLAKKRPLCPGCLAMVEREQSQACDLLGSQRAGAQEMRQFIDSASMECLIASGAMLTASRSRPHSHATANSVLGRLMSGQEIKEQVQSLVGSGVVAVANVEQVVSCSERTGTATWSPLDAVLIDPSDNVLELLDQRMRQIMEDEHEITPLVVSFLRAEMLSLIDHESRTLRGGLSSAVDLDAILPQVRSIPLSRLHTLIWQSIRDAPDSPNEYSSGLPEGYDVGAGLLALVAQENLAPSGAGATERRGVEVSAAVQWFIGQTLMLDPLHFTVESATRCWQEKRRGYVSEDQSVETAWRTIGAFSDPRDMSERLVEYGVALPPASCMLVMRSREVFDALQHQVGLGVLDANVGAIGSLAYHLGVDGNEVVGKAMRWIAQATQESTPEHRALIATDDASKW